MDELELLQAAASNANAFADLYRLHVTRVYRYHMAHVGSAKDAEDLTSQTFMAALEESSTFQRRGSFVTWLMGIAAKKRLKDTRGSRRELPVDAVLYYQSSGSTTDRASIQRQDIEATTRALKQLSPDQAEAVILTFFSDVSVSEVSHILRKSTAVTPKLILRGIRELRTRSTLTQNEESSEDQEAIASHPEDEFFAEKLTHLASQITPDPHFIAELEETLLANHRPKTKWTFSPGQIASLAGWALFIAAGIFLLYWRVAPNSESIPRLIANTGNAASTTLPEAAAGKATPRPSPTVRATATRLPTLEYIVQAGDTCTSIADRFGVTINQLITLNDLNDTCDIWIDQKLLIPVTTTSTPTD